MKTLYLDLGMGAAGDMLTGALLELHNDPDSFIKRLNNVGIPNVKIEREDSVKCGIVGTHIKVTVDGLEEGEHHHHHHDDSNHHQHHHGSMDEISHIVNDHLNINDKIKKDILAVYKLIAQAESYVHGVPVTDIHFHEVGTMDALADITAVCMLIDDLKPDEILASPVATGTGFVNCAHGILPVPAPATAYILKGIPSYSGNIESELCTPTGAALLKYFADDFCTMPTVKTEKIGYGMGKKDFNKANCVRVILGERDFNSKTDEIFELSLNIDDMTAEEISFATEEIQKAGARDVFTAPIYMKKNRLATLISVICDDEKREDVIKAIFKYTTTLGIRENKMKRYILKRNIEEIETEYGIIHRKNADGYNVSRFKYEYEDIAKVARENNVSFKQAITLIDDKNKG
jgi:uncharacterized protein (TIGR00299 family) protein